jgi:hypothetical protein
VVFVINRGVAPYDTGTPVGVLRVTIGDIIFSPLTPPESGFGSYELFSDEELQEFVGLGEDNVFRSAGFAFMALAGKASMESKMVKDYDLQVDLRSRSRELRETAFGFFAQADARDERLGVDDFMFITQTGDYEPQDGWLP